MMGVGTDALQSLAILIALVSAFSIFLSLLKSMRERKYELALIRVMGARRGELFRLIILEGLFLALIGWLFGTLLSHASMEWMASYLKDDFRYQFTGWIWLDEEIWILLVSLLLGVLAAVLPAIQAAKTDIHTTLAEK
jgi:putative ABC transport system permease protein